MVHIKITPENFQYDIETLLRAFYPKEQFAINKELEISEEDIQVFVELIKDIKTDKIKINIDGNIRETEAHFDDRPDTKNRLKRLLYSMLCDKTGRELPWGTLTGIRPVKLALNRLEEGKSMDETRKEMKSEYLISNEKLDLCMMVAHHENNILGEINYKNGYSLYVGIPFCPSRCLYCSFTSNSIDEYAHKVEDYLVALKKELSYVSVAFSTLELHSVYVGGGTPTTLNARQLDDLLGFIEDKFDFSDCMEFTVEAGRPDSITQEKLMAIKKHSVTRISINPQTMHQKTLDIIGRKHTVLDIKEKFRLARSIGFDNINMDFIVGLPGETIEDVKISMEEALKLNPDSLTIHSLAIKRAARLNMFKEDYEDYSLNNDKDIMELTAEYAKKMGMEPYYLYRQKNIAGNMENVGYAKPGKEGIYNMLIMEEKQTIAAVGAGSDTKFVRHNPESITRVDNVKNLDQYIDRVDEMIERKRNFIQENFDTISIDSKKLNTDMEDNIKHGMVVSNLAYLLGKELGLREEESYDLAVAGMLHDIGKLELAEYLYGRDRDTLSIQKMRYIRMHSSLSYDILEGRDFSDLVLESILYHHENFDGSGFPNNLVGRDIPLGARILRVCDVFAALISKRSYREAFDVETAVNLMIDEVKNFDMEVFLAFQRVIHREETRIKLEKCF